MAIKKEFSELSQFIKDTCDNDFLINSAADEITMIPFPASKEKEESQQISLITEECARCDLVAILPSTTFSETVLRFTSTDVYPKLTNWISNKSGIIISSYDMTKLKNLKKKNYDHEEYTDNGIAIYVINDDGTKNTIDIPTVTDDDILLDTPYGKTILADHSKNDGYFFSEISLSEDIAVNIIRYKKTDSGYVVSKDINDPVLVEVPSRLITVWAKTTYKSSSKKGEERVALDTPKYYMESWKDAEDPEVRIVILKAVKSNLIVSQLVRTVAE
jgi:hypothetical protein